MRSFGRGPTPAWSSGRRRPDDSSSVRLHGRIEFVEFEGDTGMVQLDSLSIDRRGEPARAARSSVGLPQLAATEATLSARVRRRRRRRRHPAAGVRRGRRGGGFRRSRSAISPGTGSTTRIRTTRRARSRGCDSRGVSERDARPAAADVRRIRRAGIDHAGHSVHRAEVATRPGRRPADARPSRPRARQAAGADVVRRLRPLGTRYRRPRAAVRLHRSPRPISPPRAANPSSRRRACSTFPSRSCTARASLRRPRPRRRRRGDQTRLRHHQRIHRQRHRACSTPRAATSRSTTCSCARCRATCGRSSSNSTICCRATGAGAGEAARPAAPPVKPALNGAEVAAAEILRQG